MAAAGERERLLSGPHRPLTISLMAAIALVSYSNLSVSAAIPSIGDDLGNVSLVPWVITAELLAGAIAVLAVGPIVDSRGVRVVFRSSMLLFIAFSMLCAFAPSMIALVLTRIGQGLAAGGVLGSTVSSIGLTYSEALRPKAYATISAVWGVMGLGGPAIAAVLISAFGWRSIFTVTVPVGLIATLIGWSRLPGRPEGDTQATFDRLGLVMVSAVTIGLLLAASAGSLYGLVWLGLAVVVGLIYVRHSRGTAAPVVRLDHITGRNWRYLHITATLAIAGGTGGTAYLPLYLRGARGASESEAAFSVLFVVIGWSTGAFVGSKLQASMHASRVVFGGALLLMTSIVASTVIVALELPISLLLGCFFLVGGGIGSVTTSSLALLQSRSASAEMGRISSAHQFLRSLGFAYGAAVGGAAMFFVVSRQISDVEAIRELLGSGSDAGLDTAGLNTAGLNTAGLNTGAVDALQDGFAWALAVTATFTGVSCAAAVKLVRATVAQNIREVLQ